MRQDQGRGALAQRRPEDLTRVDERAGERPDGYLGVKQVPKLRVEQDGPEVFPAVVSVAGEIPR